MLYNVRGINGAGKSTLVRMVMERYPPFHEETNVGMFTKMKPKIIRYDMPHDLHVLGSYAYKSSGGLDGYNPMATVWKLIGDTEEKHGGHTLFESVLLSQAKGRLLDLIDRVGADKVVLATLDTPIETCLDRIRERQAKSDRPRKRPIKEDTIRYSHGRIHNLHRFFQDKCQAVWIDHKRPLTHLLDVMKRYGGWREQHG